MAIMLVRLATAGPGLCRSCGAVITWYQLASGKRHPFDGTPVPELVQPAGQDAGVFGQLDTAVATSHFATCPQAKQWRGKGRK